MRLRNLALTAACCLIALSLGDRGILNLDTVQAQSAEDPEDYDGILVDAQVEVDKNYYLYVDSYTEVGFDLYDDIDQVEDDWYVDEDDDVFDQDSDQGDDEAGFEASSTAPVASGHEYGVESEGWACYDDGEGDCEWDYVGSAYASVDVASAAPNLTSLSVSGSGGSTVTVGTSGTLTINGTHIVGTQEDNPTIQYGGSGVTFTLAGTPTPTQAQFSYQVSSSAGVGTHNVTLTTHDGTSNGLPLTVGYPPAVITNISPSIWPAGTSFTATITGTNFGTAPTTSISAPGVTAGIATPSNGGSTIAVPITVAANAPNEPVSITVQPGYTGSNFICGSQCTGNGSGSTTAEVQAATPPNPTINFLNGTNASPFAGQAISLYVSPPSRSWAIASKSWSFGNPADVVANYLATSACGAPVPISSTAQTICGTSVPAFSTTDGTLPTFYYIVPGQSETVTVTVTYQLADGSNSPSTSTTQTFTVQGPTGQQLPIPLPTSSVATDDTATFILSPVENPSTLEMRDSPASSDIGIAFIEKGSQGSGRFIWTQLLHSVTYPQLVSPASTGYIPPTAQPEGLDGIYPYPAFSQTQSSGTIYFTSDAPAVSISAGLGEAGINFSATMYLLWDPALPSGCTPATAITSGKKPYQPNPSTCSQSIPIPLALIDWGWGACAINEGTGLGPFWVRRCGPGHTSAAVTSGYPSWSNCDVSAFGGCI